MCHTCLTVFSTKLSCNASKLLEQSEEIYERSYHDALSLFKYLANNLLPVAKRLSIWLNVALATIRRIYE